MLFIDDFLGHNILSTFYKSSKGRYDIGWDRKNRKVKKQKNGILHNSEDALIFESIEDRSCSTFYEVVEKVCSEHGNGVPGVQRVEVLLRDKERRVVGVLEENVVLVSHGSQSPGHQTRHCVVFDDLKSSDECLPTERLFDQHVDVVGDIRNTSSVSFSLPKTSFNIFPVPFSRLNTYLIEGGHYRYCYYSSLCLPECFFSHVKIFSNCIRAGIPPANVLGKREVERVVGERKGDVENAKSIIGVHTAMNLVIGAGEDRNVQVVAGKYLVGLVNVAFPLSKVLGLREMVVKFPDVYLWNPAIRVNYCQHHFFRRDSCLVEKLILKMLGTPGDVTGLSSLFVLPELVTSVANSEKPVFKLVYQLLSLQIRIFFMGLHRQKDHVAIFSSLMLCNFLHGLCEHIIVLLVVGDDEGVKNIGAE